jgi:hypothetical protein
MIITPAIVKISKAQISFTRKTQNLLKKSNLQSFITVITGPDDCFHILWQDVNTSRLALTPDR